MGEMWQDMVVMVVVLGAVGVLVRMLVRAVRGGCGGCGRGCAGAKLVQVRVMKDGRG